MCDKREDLRVCYGEALWRDSASSGRITTRVRVRADGAVDEVCFLEMGIDDQEMLECIREHMLEMEVMKTGMTLTFIFPITFVGTREPTASGERNLDVCERLLREDAGG
jgi:hypothetical protein